ncbi:MAG: YfgM family protein [Gammaproteobacteria bacterium]
MADEFFTDEERAEQFKKWWLDNWKSIAAGVIIALVIIFGWRYWQHRTETRGLTASELYMEMGQMLAVGQGPAALKLANELVGKYRDTPYAAQAALAMAQYDVGTSKPDDAMQMLDWVIQNSKDSGLRLLARVRLAQVKIEVGDPHAALVALEGVAPGGFAALFDLTRGDAYVKLGETGQARAAYAQALKAWTPEMGDDSLVRMKLESVGGTVPPAAAASSAPATGASAPASASAAPAGTATAPAATSDNGANYP